MHWASRDIVPDMAVAWGRADFVWRFTVHYRASRLGGLATTRFFTMKALLIHCTAVLACSLPLAAQVSSSSIQTVAART